MTWTIQADEAALLTAVAVEAEDLSWAMVLREADKQGNLSVPRCQALGISNGRCTALASCLHVAERPCPVGFTLRFLDYTFVWGAAVEAVVARQPTVSLSGVAGVVLCS
jgi:hypothetical protein